MPQTMAELAILPGWTTASGGQVSALAIDLPDGWKTYWRAPGDAGIPPRIDWSGSQNLAAIEVVWPVPEVFFDYGMRSIGYMDGVVFPLMIEPERPGAPVTLAGQLDIGVCEEVCVPVSITFSTALEPGNVPDPRIVAALADRPMTVDEAGVGAVTCAFEPFDHGLRLTARVENGRLASDEAAVVEVADPDIWSSVPVIDRQGASLVVETDLMSMSSEPMLIDRSDIRFTLIAEGQAIDIQGCQPA